MLLRLQMGALLATAAFAALCWWQWGLAADRADRAEARVEALTQRLGDIRRDAERDRAIDDAPLGDLPDEWRVPE